MNVNDIFYSRFCICGVFGLDKECSNTELVVSSIDRDNNDHIEINSLTDVLQKGATSL